MKLADVFQNGAVLQQKKPIVVWGTDDNGRYVKAVLSGEEPREARAEIKDGKFVLTFAPMQAQKEARLVLENDLGEKIELEDLAIGEVWLAGGQSNMEFLMKWDAEREDFLEEYENTAIRFYEVPKISYEGALEEEDHSSEGIWRKAVPGELPYFSAVAFYFANRLQREWKNVPIGLIGCNWGGTSVSCWMPEEDLIPDFQTYMDLKNQTLAYDLEQGFEAMKKRRKRELSAEEKKNQDLFMQTPILAAPEPRVPNEDMKLFQKYKYAPFSAFAPGVLYQTMLKKITPYTCAGVIWYQGEEDSLPEYGGKYDLLFARMIERWRKDWGENLPFIFAQLVAYENPGGILSLDFTEVRAGQELVSKAVKGAWMAVTYDTGLRYDIHPKQKRPVGERMAGQALNHVYGCEIDSESPDVTGIRKEEGALVLTLEHTGEGLELRGSSGEVEGMELMVNGRTMEDFCATVEKDKIRIASDRIQAKDRISLRYAWKDWMVTNVYSSMGLPLRPFKIEC